MLKTRSNSSWIESIGRLIHRPMDKNKERCIAWLPQLHSEPWCSQDRGVTEGESFRGEGIGEIQWPNYMVEIWWCRFGLDQCLHQSRGAALGCVLCLILSSTF